MKMTMTKARRLACILKREDHKGQSGVMPNADRPHRTPTKWQNVIAGTYQVLLSDAQFKFLSKAEYKAECRIVLDSY